MALQKTMTIPVTVVKAALFGVIGETQSSETINDVYIKVVRVSGSKEKAVADVSFSSQNFSGSKSYEFAPEMVDKNFIAQAYEYLKTLPEFADAQDC